jgi:hypothetical protein
MTDTEIKNLVSEASGPGCLVWVILFGMFVKIQDISFKLSELKQLIESILQ